MYFLLILHTKHFSSQLIFKTHHQDIHKITHKTKPSYSKLQNILPWPQFQFSFYHWGKWDLLILSNIGVSSMHMQLLNTDSVVIFDRTDFGVSNISLPNDQCHDDPNDLTLKHDCTAHSVEYDVASNSIHPLNVLTNVWCSSGAAMPDGSLIQTSGFNDGYRIVRLYKPYV